MALVLLLPLTTAEATPSYEYVQYTGAGTSEQHTQSAVALIPAASHIDLLVPSRALSWHRAKMPAAVLKDKQRTRQVIEGILEERLLDEPSALHFSLSPRASETGEYWIGACDALWLAGHLRGLEASGRRVGRIVPEAAPGEGPAWVHVTSTSQGPWLVMTNLQESVGSLTIPLESPGQTVAVAAAIAADSPRFTAESDVVAAAESVLGHPVAPISRAQYITSRLDTEWDLAQFQFATTGKARLAKTLGQVGHALAQGPHWRAARWGLLALLASQIVGLNVWAWNERRQQQSTRDTVVETARRAFPSLKLVIDAPVQMQRELAQLRQRSGIPGPGDFETMLTAMGDSLAANARIGQLDYDGQSLRTTVIGQDGASRDELESRLRAKGYQLVQDGERLVLSEGRSR